MPQLYRKSAAVGFLALLVFWVVGTVQGPAAPNPQAPAWYLPVALDPLARLSCANNLHQLGFGHMPLPQILDQADWDRIQVFEKNARLEAATPAFDDEEFRIRSALREHQGIVLNENSSGIAPERRLTLEIGVYPEKFDGLVEQLRQITQLESVSVQQADRTGEFRRLHAQRQSLKKHLESVLKLRDAKNASIDNALKLEQKIQDIDKELQSLSVQFGDFLGKQSFYHVSLTLSEVHSSSGLERVFTLDRRLFHALLWALGRWFALAASIGVLAATYLSLHVLWPRLPISATARAREPAA
jgi:Domain of unknown function (DUF4349)